MSIAVSPSDPRYRGGFEKIVMGVGEALEPIEPGLTYFIQAEGFATISQGRTLIGQLISSEKYPDVHTLDFYGNLDDGEVRKALSDAGFATS